MKAILPAALVVALALAGYAAVGGPGKDQAPQGPKPWHNPDKAKADALPGQQPMGREIQPRQLGVSVSAPFQVQPNWTTNPLYVEWYHERYYPGRTELHRVSDPY